jgi:N6-adenosine-specific RNA methylase IME4
MTKEIRNYYIGFCSTGILESYACTWPDDPQIAKISFLLESADAVKLNRGNYLKLRTEQRNGVDIIAQLKEAAEIEKSMEGLSFLKQNVKICDDCFSEYEGEYSFCAECHRSHKENVKRLEEDNDTFYDLVEECQKNEHCYEVIYADPPWNYNDKAVQRIGANRHYPTMTLDKIKQMPVASIAEENSILFMWVTMPMLQQGLDVIEAWGFKYTTCGFSWFKRNKVKHSLFIGGGHYTRSNTELCLIGVRGKPIKRVSRSVWQAHDIEVDPIEYIPYDVQEPDTEYLGGVVEQGQILPIEGHSKKPDKFAEDIVTLFGDVPRIELFARDAKEGWHAWGNEVGFVTNSEEVEVDDLSFLE